MTARTFDELRAAVVAFRDERDWRQFHTPKNLAMAVMTEASELGELYLWRNNAEELSPALVNRSAEEMSDVLIYLISMADVLGIDLVVAAQEKLVKNAKKYPIEAVRGSVAHSESRRLESEG